MLYISELCKDCTVANEIDYEIDYAWTSIHDNGHVVTGVWRLTFYSALVAVYSYALLWQKEASDKSPKSEKVMFLRLDLA